MLTLFGILIIVTSIVLGLLVLVQNPKGGGLSGTFGGFGNQLMGVKQTNDVLEKGTWIFGGIVALLCLMSPAFLPKDGTGKPQDDLLKNAPTSVPASNQAPPASTVPMPAPTTPAPGN